MMIGKAKNPHMKNNTHGGKREGAGRKPRIDGRRRRLVSVTLTDDELELVKTLSPDERREVLIGRVEHARMG